MWSAVFPDRSNEHLALAARSWSTIVSSPSFAALCKGVNPRKSIALIWSGVAVSKSCVTSSYFLFLIAKCKGVVRGKLRESPRKFRRPFKNKKKSTGQLQYQKKSNWIRFFFCSNGILLFVWTNQLLFRNRSSGISHFLTFLKKFFNFFLTGLQVLESDRQSGSQQQRKVL